MTFDNGLMADRLKSTGTRVQCLMWAVISLSAVFWAAGVAANPNVLLIIADDMGVDQVGVYQGSGAASLTPRIDELANTGLRFTNAWSNPICSPTRATMLTGRYGFRTGVGWISTPSNNGIYAIQPDEYTLPMALATLGVRTANIGKWHLSNGLDDPNIMGYEYFSGAIEGKLDDYFDWSKVTNGVETQVQNYATTETVDDALDWIDQQSDQWFLWLAFNAPHDPFHKPPNHLHRYDQLPLNPAVIQARPTPYYKAAVQALDTEIGRLLDSLDPETRANTLVILLSDNGTPGKVTLDPYEAEHAKATLYQGGVHVPLIVHGAGVTGSGRRVDHLVNTSDIFATILESYGYDLGALPDDRNYDSISFMPYIQNPSSGNLRNSVFAEQFQTTVSNVPSLMGGTIRSRQYKVMQFENDTEEFYDLVADPLELSDLLQQPLTARQQRAYDTLVRRMDVLLSTE